MAPPNWIPLTGASNQCANKFVCLRRRSYVVVEVRRRLRCLSAAPEGVLNLAKEAFATRRQPIRFFLGVVNQLFWADGQKYGM